MPPPAVALKGITKAFPGHHAPVVANDGVDLTVAAGECHVIVGENGAGKSTLMNILYGLEQPDAGSIAVHGKGVAIESPAAAIGLGIGMIHQHFMLVPSFTIGENIVLGREPSRASLIDRRRVRRDVAALSSELGLAVDPEMRVEDATVGVQQRVEILKVLYRGARILILDEPTAVLTPQEADGLFGALARLKAAGATVIMITHKLPEVVAIADRVTVMRDGRVVGAIGRGEIDEERLAELMTGRPWRPDRLPRAAVASKHVPALEVRGLSCRDDRGLVAVDGASFALGAGEILAIAGVGHNGQEELAEAIMGEREAIAGTVLIAGSDVTGATVRDRRARGAGHVPDDRTREGSAPGASVARNMIMGAHRKPPLGNGVTISPRAVRRWVGDLIARYGIKALHPGAPISSLSGGNVQKAIVAREIAMTTCFLVAEQPSRGVDIGAAEAIYDQLIRLRDDGIGVLLVSMDLTETLRLADRILVMYRGRIVGERRPEETDPLNLGRLMAGIAAEARPG